MMSAQYGSAVACEAFLAARADVHAQDEDGWTALHHACQAVRYTNALQPLETLLRWRADINHAAFEGQTALFLAVSVGNSFLVKCLFQGGATFGDYLPSLGH